jgi:Flp pilus assembly protein TadD
VPPGPAPWGQERLAKRRLALELNREGEEWFAEGDYLKASRCFLKAVKEDRACAVAFNNLAVIFLAMQRPEEAWTYAIEALHLEPYLDTARENLRDVAAVTGRESEAARILELFGRG